MKHFQIGVVALFLSSAILSCSRPMSPTPPRISPSDQQFLDSLADSPAFAEANANFRKRISLSPATRGADAPDFRELPSPGGDFDAIHYNLSLEFPAECLTRPEFDAHLLLTFRPNVESFQVLKLDSSKLKIQAVTLLNTAETLRFDTSGETLAIDLGRVYSPRDTLNVMIDYRWEGRSSWVTYRNRFGKDSTEAIATFSEPEHSKDWIPSRSSPDDRATFETHIRVPKPLSVVSNGALVSVEDEGDFREFHWSLAQPMPTYLFSFAIADFGVHRLSWKGIPVEYYGMKDEMEFVKYSLRETLKMLDVFTSVLGVPYPYAKYAQVVIPGTSSNGMEHVTATTLGGYTLHGPAQEEEFTSNDLVSHELAHQWFGDYVTCKDWSHTWLNEGSASYFELVYAERTMPRDFFLERLDIMSRVYLITAPNYERPIVTRYFQDSLDMYFDLHGYYKGAWVHHMLRREIGDLAYFTGLREYLFSNQFGLVTTEDFKRSMERASGRDLTWFFDQWLYRPGHPEFKTAWSYDPTARAVTLSVTQTQNLAQPGGVWGVTPSYRGKIDVEVDCRVQSVELTGRGNLEEKFVLPWGGAESGPRYVKFNSSTGWLARVVMDQPWSAWRAQLRTSTDAAARVEAAKVIGAMNGSSAVSVEERVAALLECGSRDATPWVREVCLNNSKELVVALSGAAYDTAAQTLISLSSDSNWRVRRAAAGVIGRLRPEDAVPHLRGVLATEPSVSVLAAAIDSLANFVSDPTVFETMKLQLSRSSFRETVREAVLKAFARIEDPRTFEIAEEFASARYPHQPRVAAFALLAKLALKDRDYAYEHARVTLEAQLADPFTIIRMQAATALGKMKSEKSLPLLERLADQDLEERVRGAAAAAVAQIRGN